MAVELVSAQRYLRRLVSCGHGLLSRVNMDSKLLHYEWKASENTGRLYSNIQNYVWALRDFLLPDEGEVLVTMDYQSQELRILLHETGETELLKMLDEGGDFHKKMAGLVFLAGGEVTEQQRDRAKAITYGIPYGQRAAGLAYRWGISTAKAKKVVEQYHKTRPKLQPWLDKMIDKSKANGFLETRAGQRRYDCPEDAIVNNKIQAEAADMLCAVLIRVDEILQSMGIGRILAGVHDSIVMSLKLKVYFESNAVKLPLQELDKVYYLQRAMEQTKQGYGNMPVDRKFGKTWGACR